MRLARQTAIGMIALLPLAPSHARAQDGQAKGWVGIVITTGIGQTDRTGAMMFGEYPVIESIEPGSPAERAGLMAGDVIISINSQDMKKNPVPPSSMLEPGQKVTVRYRRSDVMKTSVVKVEPRPVGNPQTVVLSIFGPVPGSGRPGEGGPTRVNVRQPMPPVVEISPLAMPSGMPTIGIAGALLTQLNNDMRDALSVKGRGVFVINVETGTPAGESGLKGGDVILMADKESVGNPGELIRIMRASADQALKLQVVRKRKTQTITLRW